MVLIKENHAAAAGGVGAAVRRGRARRSRTSPLEVECRDAAEIAEALEAGAPRILLDNMAPDELRAAVAQVGGRARARGQRRDHARDRPGARGRRG